MCRLDEGVSNCDMHAPYVYITISRVVRQRNTVRNSWMSALRGDRQHVKLAKPGGVE